MSVEPIQVVYLASGDLWAGAEVQLFTLCKFINNFEDIKIKVILFNEGELLNRLLQESIEVTIIDENKYSSIQIFTKVRKQLKFWEPDLLHTHRQKENIIGSLASIGIGITSIRTVHGSPEYKTGWKYLHKLFLLKLDEYIGKFIQKKIVSVSPELTLRLENTYKSEQISTICNGVNIEELECHLKNIDSIFSNDIIRIGIIGRLVPVKKIDVFLKVAHLCTTNDKNNSFIFEIYGDGPLRQELEQSIIDMNLSDTVFLRGHKNNIFQNVCKLDFLLITSEHEGLPMILLESMFIGIPIISSPVGAIPDVLKNGECGAIVSKNIPKFYSDSIKHSIENKKDTLQKSILARDRIIQKYTAFENADKYRKLYWALIS